jgi:FMN-dependent NADH-azoreductase
MKLLHVDSSILENNSVSRRLTAAIVANWQARVPGLDVTYRDLAATPVPHLSAAFLGAAGLDPSAHSLEMQRDLAISAAVMDEFLAADVVVIGAPMYNFSVPSTLKAWIDRLAVRGKTFEYSAEGARGLAGGKKVIVASSRGGIYSAGSALAPIDHQEPYIEAVLRFFGITDIDVVRAEGVNLGPEQKDQAIASAELRIPQLLAA